MLGTNPVALAAPAHEEPPFVLDMATSAVTLGKPIVARRTARRVPLGWAQDRDGNDTDDPAVPWEGGWLMPLGGRPETSGYKGYGLAAMVDALSGVLSVDRLAAGERRGRWRTGRIEPQGAAGGETAPAG